MELILAIALFAFSSGITPGPNNIMLMTSGVNFGIKSSVPHLLGICIGFPSMVLAIGLGMTALFTAFPELHTVIRYLGIGYMLYLAYLIASASSQLEGKTKPKPLSFIQAAAFQWVNPKAWVMALGAVATFTSMQSALAPQALTIALVFMTVAFPCALVWLYFGLLLKKLLQSAKHQRLFNITMALLLVISILPMMAS